MLTVLVWRKKSIEQMEHERKRLSLCVCVFMFKCTFALIWMWLNEITSATDTKTNINNKHFLYNELNQSAWWIWTKKNDTFDSKWGIYRNLSIWYVECLLCASPPQLVFIVDPKNGFALSLTIQIICITKLHSLHNIKLYIILFCFVLW